jgi:hypothetical protein
MINLTLTNGVYTGCPRNTQKKMEVEYYDPQNKNILYKYGSGNAIVTDVSAKVGLEIWL